MRPEAFALARWVTSKAKEARVPGFERSPTQLLGSLLKVQRGLRKDPAGYMSYTWDMNCALQSPQSGMHLSRSAYFGPLAKLHPFPLYPGDQLSLPAERVSSQALRECQRCPSECGKAPKSKADCYEEPGVVMLELYYLESPRNH